MKIQPISSWINGQEKLGTEFNLRLISDDLATTATFYYSISSVEVSHLEEEVKVIDTYAQLLVEGNLTISGEDYTAWDADPSANEAAYAWSLAKLNLVPVIE